MIDKTNSFDEYLAYCDENVKNRLILIRNIIKEEAPEAVEKISYGMPTFYLTENLVHFAASKHHIGFYPTPSGVEFVQSELDSYHWSKGAIRFSLYKPIPEELIRKIVRFRVLEVLNKHDNQNKGS